jgi:hypothetical protein
MQASEAEKSEDSTAEISEEPTDQPETDSTEKAPE